MEDKEDIHMQDDEVTKSEPFDPALPEGAIDVSNMKDNGIMKVILTPGEGDALPGHGDTVVVHYTGTIWGGEKHGLKFDSSRDRNQTFEFKLGEGQVIAGWDQGVATMKKGEKSDLYCKPKYAYGKSGSGDSIPPNATLKFEVELLYWKGEDLSPENNGSICRCILKKGTAYQSPNDGAVVDVHVKIYKSPGHTEIESEKEVKFDLGDGAEHGIPKAIEIALKKMKKSEVSRLTLKPPYSTNEAEQVIDVELKNFEKMKESWELKGAEEKLAQAELLKAKGTEYFKKNKFPMAQILWKKATDYLEHDTDFKDGASKEDSCDSCGEDDDHKHKPKTKEAKPATEQNGDSGPSNLEKRRTLLVALHLNLSLSHLKQENYPECIHSCDKAIEFDPQSEKAYFRRGQAQFATKEYDAAKVDFAHALKIDPNNKAAHTQLAACNAKIQEQIAKDKKTFYGMFDKFAKQDSKSQQSAAKSESPSKSESNGDNPNTTSIPAEPVK